MITNKLSCSNVKFQKKNFQRVTTRTPLQNREKTRKKRMEGRDRSRRRKRTGIGLL